MCTLTSNANAEEEVHYIINENFNTLGVSERANISGWVLSNCWGAYNGDGTLTNKCLNIYDYATTKQFSKNGNAILVFYYRDSNKSKQSTISVTVNNGGLFENGTNSKNYTPGGAVFKVGKEKIYNVTESTTITFKMEKAECYACIDDLQVIAAENLTLSETAPNISQTEKTADVTLGRTLQGGIWNTLCLPFDVDKAFTLPKALGEGQNIQLRTFSSYTGGTINFEDKESVKAGTPFLIKIDNTVTNPTFPLVDVKNTSPQIVEYGGVSMVGTYGQTSISSDAIFLTSSGELMKPSGSTTLKGLRAYFTTTDGSRLTINFGDATAVKNVQAPAATTSDWFTLDGRRLASQPTKKGLYIRNGKKIIIK